MIKNINDITIGDLHRMEVTGKISHFKLWYNILPVYFFIRKIFAVTSDIYMQISNGKSDNFEEIIKIYEYEFYANLLIEVNRLKATELLFENILGNLTKLVQLKSLFINKKLNKIKNDPIGLAYAVKEAKELTDINVESLNDFFKFRERVREREDRLTTYVGKKNEENIKSGTKIGILEYAIIVMDNLNKDLDVEKMKAVVFIKYNQLFLKKVEALNNKNTENGI